MARAKDKISTISSRQPLIPGLVDLAEEEVEQPRRRRLDAGTVLLALATALALGGFFLLEVGRGVLLGRGWLPF